MLHYGYLDEVKQAKNKDDRNRRLLLRALERRPGDFAIRWAVAEYFSNFLERPEARIIMRLVTRLSWTAAGAPGMWLDGAPRHAAPWRA